MRKQCTQIITFDTYQMCLSMPKLRKMLSFSTQHVSIPKLNKQNANVESVLLRIFTLIISNLFAVVQLMLLLFASQLHSIERELIKCLQPLRLHPGIMQPIILIWFSSNACFSRAAVR